MKKHSFSSCLILILILFFFLSPFLVMIYYSFKESIEISNFSFIHYKEMFHLLPSLFSLIQFNILFCLLAALATCFLSFSAAYCMCRKPFRKQKWFFILVNFILIIPNLTLILGIYLSSHYLVFSHWISFLAYIVWKIPIIFYIFYYFGTHMPKTIEKIIKLDTLHRKNALKRVILPLLKNNFLYCFVLIFVYNISDLFFFLFLQNFGTENLSSFILLHLEDFPAIMSFGVLICMLFLLINLCLFYYIRKIENWVNLYDSSNLENSEDQR